MMGWDETFLQSAVDTCTNPSGRIEDCPLFTIQDSSTYSNCKFPMPDDQNSANLQNPGSSLPGGVQVQAGPGYAVKGGSGGGAGNGGGAATVPTLSHSDGSTVATAGTYLPGAVFVASSAPTTTPDSPPTTPTPTPTPAVPINNKIDDSSSPTPTPSSPSPTGVPLLPNQSIFSTMYKTVGQQVLEVVLIEEEVTVTEQATTTATVVQQQRRKRDRHVGRHAHAHARGAGKV